MHNIWQMLADTSPAILIKTSTWAYPILETAHVIGLGLLFGCVVMMDLRLLGFGCSVSISTAGRYLLPWVWIGFIINVISGTLLFISDAAEFSGNSAFRLKIVLIALAGLNALLFHRNAYHRSLKTPSGQRLPVASLLAAATSIALWIFVITAGRMIAYVN